MIILMYQPKDIILLTSLKGNQCKIMLVLPHNTLFLKLQLNFSVDQFND